VSQTAAKNEDSEREVHKDHDLYVVFAVTIMAVLGTSSVALAFPEVAQEFGVSRRLVGLLITVFTLLDVFLTPFLGALSNRFGWRKILIPLLMPFGSMGGACAVARDFDLLLALRTLQGTGAAMRALNVSKVDSPLPQRVSEPLFLEFV